VRWKAALPTDQVDGALLMGADGIVYYHRPALSAAHLAHDRGEHRPLLARLHPGRDTGRRAGSRRTAATTRTATQSPATQPAVGQPAAPAPAVTGKPGQPATPAAANAATRWIIPGLAALGSGGLAALGVWLLYRRRHPGGPVGPGRSRMAH
jgi:hypothetical protein